MVYPTLNPEKGGVTGHPVFAKVFFCRFAIFFFFFFLDLKLLSLWPLELGISFDGRAYYQICLSMI